MAWITTTAVLLIVAATVLIAYGMRRGGSARDGWVPIALGTVVAIAGALFWIVDVLVRIYGEH